MLYNRLNLEVAKFASKSEARPELAGVFFTSKKSVATDSFKLVEITTPQGLEVKDFPRLNGKSPMFGCQPFIVPASEVKKIKIPKENKNLPVLNNVAISHLDKEKVEFLTTDLTSAETKVIRRIEGRFPDYEKVIPQGKPMAQVSVNAEYLAEIAEFMAKANGRGLKDVVIKFFGEGKPIVFETANKETGQKAKGLLMPLKV